MKDPVLALTWLDKKGVHATGTYTQTPAQQLAEVNGKPLMAPLRKYPVLNWCNTYMGGVDKKKPDEVLLPHPSGLKEMVELSRL